MSLAGAPTSRARVPRRGRRAMRARGRAAPPPGPGPPPRGPREARGRQPEAEGPVGQAERIELPELDGAQREGGDADRDREHEAGRAGDAPELVAGGVGER